jgi:hypothetical protein
MSESKSLADVIKEDTALIERLSGILRRISMTIGSTEWDWAKAPERIETIIAARNHLREKFDALMQAEVQQCNKIPSYDMCEKENIELREAIKILLNT